MQANFDEARQSQLPAVELLINMGYTYLSCEELKKQRREDNGKFILKDIAFESLKKINHFEYKGETYPFSDKNVWDAIEELENIQVQGLQDTAREVYHLIMTEGGKTFPVTIDGQKSSQNFRFIDFQNPRNNSFHITVEVPVNGKRENIRPDIVCYINGIPFVVIENKKSGTAVTDALHQMNRNQKPDYSPKFFVYPQLLIGTNVEECLYGTTGTPTKFYASWKEKETDLDVLDQEIQKHIHTHIDPEIYKAMCVDMNGVDKDENIFVLIDEAHRTQYGMASEEMRRMIPNACFIGFTGTPLLKNDKSHHRFGGFIDKYTFDDGLEDGIVLPLIYEGRYTELNQNKDKVYRHVERITEGLDSDSVKDLQRFINQKVIKNNPHRITEIAYDIEDHFRSYFQGTGLKAQLVAPSKYSALLFQKVFEEGGRLRTAVVISEAQSHDDETDSHKQEVADFLKKKSADYKDLESYEKSVTESFKTDPDGIEILIVVDKLLTGFNAPRNTVLFLTKDLKDHNLLQAIARVNRLYENKDKPKTAGFIIDYSENAQNIKSAMELFGNFDDEDVKGTLIDTTQKISELEQAYSSLEGHFKTVKNKKDTESYLEFLGTEHEDEQRRNDFYSLFNGFVRNLDECMSLPDFSARFAHLDTYKLELKRYAELKKTAQIKFADRKDFSEYKKQLVKIVDEYIDADKVEMLTEPININDSEVFDQALEALGTPKSKAEAIASQMQRTITEKADTDPEFYRRFSDKIQDILKKMREGKMAYIEALKRLREAREKMINYQKYSKVRKEQIFFIEI